jgi:hypothetical protein
VRRVISGEQGVRTRRRAAVLPPAQDRRSGEPTVEAGAIHRCRCECGGRGPALCQITLCDRGAAALSHSYREPPSTRSGSGKGLRRRNGG